jgi:hypothetical protein
MALEPGRARPETAHGLTPSGPHADSGVMKVLPVAVLIVLVAAVGAPRATPSQLPTAYTNLQVLPKDITQDQLMSVMKASSLSLGVRCWYCHEGQGDDFSTFNFAADTKAPKETARAMLRLTSQINNALKDVGPNKGATGKVTCQTCHRGNKTPVK